jgi:hypothetical protein
MRTRLFYHYCPDSTLSNVPVMAATVGDPGMPGERRYMLAVPATGDFVQNGATGIDQVIDRRLSETQAERI